MADCSNCKKGVILYSGAIGDCLLTLPLAHYIKQQCRLDILDYIGPTGYLEFYPHRTCIDRVRSIETVPLHHLFEDPKTFMQSEHPRLQAVFEGYEQVITLLGVDDPHFEKNLLFTLHSTHSAELTAIPAKPTADSTRHVSEYYIDYFKQDNLLTETVSLPETYITPLSNDHHAGADLITEAKLNPDQNLLLIHPGSGSLEKCWHLENFMQIASDLRNHNTQAVFLLGPAAQERFPAPDLSRLRHHFITLENMSLTQIMQTLTQTDIFLGNDSGIAHLSAMMGKKTITLFGSSNSQLYHPLGPAVKVLSPDLDSFSAPNPTAAPG